MKKKCRHIGHNFPLGYFFKTCRNIVHPILPGMLYHSLGVDFEIGVIFVATVKTNNKSLLLINFMNINHNINHFIMQVFNENWVIEMLKLNFWFPVNTLSLLWPMDTKLGVWVAYIKRQLWIATQVSLIKVTVAKNRIQFLLKSLSLFRPIDTKLGV
jgi:hypothetical protein